MSQDLLNLLINNLQQQLNAANLTLEDLQKLKDTADKIKEKKDKIEELQKQIDKIKEEIRQLKEPIEPIIGTLRDADGLRLTLIGLGLLEEETLKLIIGNIYNGKKRNNGKKYVIFEGERFNSITAFLETLQKNGIITLPESKYNPSRYLESWAKQNGYTIEETKTEIYIKKPKSESSKETETEKA